MRASLIALLFLVACEDKPKEAPPTPPPSPEALGIDASVLGESIDPPAPAGDLKAELDRFVNVETCVNDRAKLDPLVGDAIGAIGYDTLFRDACRLLDAAKQRRAEACEPIDASPLRRRCQSWVAMITNQADACPLVFEGVAAKGRDPSCVAVASRDPRLCSAEIRAGARVACEALVKHDAGTCASLRPMQKLACEREVTRWRDVLLTPLEGLPALPTPKATMTLGSVPDAGADDAGVPVDVDLGAEIANGVVVIARGDTMRVEIGSLLESEAMHLAAPPSKRPRAGLVLAADGKASSVARLELVQPNEAAYVVPPATCECKLTGFTAEAKRGAPLSFHLDAKLAAGTRTQTMSLEVTTWVRDVVQDRAGTLRPSTLLRPPAARDGGI